MKGFHELPDDGGSRIVEQIRAQRRELSQRLSQVQEIIAVGSGKGGVGKSTLVMQLACALREKGRSVAILDADINGPTQARLGGVMNALLVPGANGLLMPRTSAGIGVVSFGSFVSENSAVDFPSITRSDSHTWRATKEFAVLTEIICSTDWGSLDFLLIDLPPGAERTFQFAQFFEKRASFLLVTLPTAVSKGVVKRSIDSLRRSASPILGYVENMSGYFCSGCNAVQPLFTESTAVDLGIPLLGQVPFDPELARYCDEGRGMAACKLLPVFKYIRSLADNLLEKEEHHEIPMRQVR